MKLAITIILIATSCATARGQSTRVLAGKITDIDSGRPLEWASIIIGQRGIGTISNSAGEFEISVFRDWENDSLIVSYLGYKKYLRKIADLSSNNVIVKLTPETVVLENVLINASKVSGDVVIRNAIAAVKSNYPNDAFILEGYYREVTRQDDRHVNLVEAAIQTYDKSFQRKLTQGITEDVLILAARQSLNYADDVVKNVRKQNPIADLLDNNPVHYQRGILNPKYFKYTIDSIIQNETQSVFLISTEPMAHKIYVEDGSFAILKTVEEVKNPGMHRPEFRLNDSLVVRRMAYFQSVCEFQRHRGKMYVKYINETDAFEIVYKNSGQRKFYVESFKEFVATNVIDSGVVAFGKKEKYDFTDEGLAKVRRPGFWKDHPTIQLAPLDRNTRKELEWDIPLQEQFQKK
jgi:hypothetical protein